MDQIDGRINALSWVLFLREALKGNASARQTLNEYLAHVDKITGLARQCLARLETGHQNYSYFHLLSLYGEVFKKTLHPSSYPHVDPHGPPTTAMISPHENSLRRLAVFHNRAVGHRKNTKPGFFNAVIRFFESGPESDVPDLDPSDPKTKDLLPKLVDAMRTQIEYAKNLSWAPGSGA